MVFVLLISYSLARRSDYEEDYEKLHHVPWKIMNESLESTIPLGFIENCFKKIEEFIGFL